MRYLHIFFCCLFCFQSHAQFSLETKKDLVTIGSGLALAATSYFLEQNAVGAIESDVLHLDRMDISVFDRGATYNFSSGAQAISDVILYTSISIPLLMQFDKKCRVESWSILVMGFETFLFTNALTGISKSITTRYRPFNYNETVDLSVKLGKTSRRSFVSGHTSNAAAFSFFAAKVLSTLHPEMKNKRLLWISAVTIPAAIGYFRFRAGKHFPTDIIGGYILGAGIGYLVPSIHLNSNMDITPMGRGIKMNLQF